MAGTVATVESLQQMIKNCKGFERIFSNLKILCAGDGNCVAELKIEEEHLNRSGTLHGGLSGTLVDSISTYALMTHERGTVPNVSVDLHLSYMKGANLGEEILIDAKTTRCGRTLAFLEVLITNKKGDILVKGTHTKFLMQMKGE